jgi:hypothetical protein
VAAKSKRATLVDTAVLAPLDWIDERSGAVRGTKWFLFRNVPRDISWAQTLGFATLIAFVTQTLTGGILAMYYEPSSSIDPVTGKPIAYASIESITNEPHSAGCARHASVGRERLHHPALPHMGRVFLFGAYKYPRELQWITGVLLLVTGMLLGFTGYLLPWDQTAYWATVVGINLNGTAPFLGPWLAQFLASGPEIGPDALAKWYALHMLLLPGAVFALIGIHLYLVARLGVSCLRGRKSRPAVSGRQRSRPARERGSSGAARAEVGSSGPRSRRAEPRVVRALQGRRQEGGQALLPARDAARHDHGIRRRARDRRPRRDLVLGRDGVEPRFSGRCTRSPPTRRRRTSSRGRTGTSTSSSTSSGSSSGRRRSSSQRSASRRSA